MSREIRPVAIGWEHPRNPGTYTDGSPRFAPLHSRDALRAHLESYAGNPADWGHEAPDPADYMPEIPEGSAYGWALYETVSEGTPCSPTFGTKGELAAWLASRHAGRARMAPEVAATFVEQGWAPSFYSSPQTGFISGMEWVGRS